jgi:recombination protein RecT
MGNELVIIERQLEAIRPRIEAALGGIMPANRLEQTILVSCERTPALLACTPQSILNAAMTFAVLGLPVDGATGQGFMIPFKRQAQAVIGYRGYNTLGARAGLTITAGTVREDDEFDFELGSHAYLRHRPKLGSRSRSTAFWSCATASDRPPIIVVLSMDAVMRIKASSAAVKSERPTPWNDPEIGFPAMGEKSARRRLARSTPLRIDQPQFQLAAAMEEAVDERGKLAWVTPSHGVVVEGEPAARMLPGRESETPDADHLLGAVSQPASQADTEKMLREEAEKGTAALQTAWMNLSYREQNQWSRMKDLEFKPMALEADRRASGEEEV